MCLAWHLSCTRSSCILRAGILVHSVNHDVCAPLLVRAAVDQKISWKPSLVACFSMALRPSVDVFGSWKVIMWFSMHSSSSSLSRLYMEETFHLAMRSSASLNSLGCEFPPGPPEPRLRPGLVGSSVMVPDGRSSLLPRAHVLPLE